MQHYLKTNPKHFNDLHQGQFCSVRKNDRNFAVGDEVVAIEYDKEKERATGHSHLFLITHIQTGFGLQDGYVALSLISATL